MKKKAFRRKNYNANLVSANRAYTVQEIAELFNTHKQTVRRWIKNAGLPVIDSKKPMFVHGQQLKSFLQEYRSKGKFRCELDEMFCTRCKKPQKVLKECVDIRSLNQDRIILQSFCSVCDNLMSRIGSRRQLPKFRKMFKTQSKAEKGI